MDSRKFWRADSIFFPKTLSCVYLSTLGKNRFAECLHLAHGKGDGKVTAATWFQMVFGCLEGNAPARKLLIVLVVTNMAPFMPFRVIFVIV